MEFEVDFFGKTIDNEWKCNTKKFRREERIFYNNKKVYFRRYGEEKHKKDQDIRLIIVNKVMT